MEKSMPIVVRTINLGSLEKPSIQVEVESVSKPGRTTAYQRRLVRTISGTPLLPPLLEMSESRTELEDLALAAFNLGRDYQRASDTHKKR